MDNQEFAFGSEFSSSNEHGEAFRQLHRLVPILSRSMRFDSLFLTRFGPDQGLKHASWIMCDNLVSLRKSELSHYVATLPPAKLAELDRALRTALSL